MSLVLEVILAGLVFLSFLVGWLHHEYSWYRRWFR